jgi:hypothetical protein
LCSAAHGVQGKHPGSLNHPSTKSFIVNQRFDAIFIFPRTSLVPLKAPSHQTADDE